MLPSCRCRRVGAYRRQLPHSRGVHRKRALRDPDRDDHSVRGQTGLLGVQGLRGGGGVAHEAGAALPAPAGVRGAPEGDAPGPAGPERDGGAQRYVRVAARHLPQVDEEELLPERLPTRVSHRRRYCQRPSTRGSSRDPHTARDLRRRPGPPAGHPGVPPGHAVPPGQLRGLSERDGTRSPACWRWPGPTRPPSRWRNNRS